MNSVPSYSVIIPAFNAAETIAEAVRSVLAQTVPASEIIVVDDGSSDDTARIATAMSPILTLIWQQNSGPGAATTRAMAACRHDLIAAIDADDIWMADKMQEQLSHLATRYGFSGVFARLRLFRDGAPDGPERDGWQRSTMVIRRDVFASVGDVIDPPGKRGELVDWIARAREQGFRLDMIPKVLVRRRVRPGSLSYGYDRHKDRGYLHVARQALLRRRSDKVGT